MPLTLTHQDQLDLTALIPTQRADSDPARPHGCGGCPARWSGTRTSHCGACHVTFGGVTAFDLHRAGGRCAQPRRLGMALLPGRAYARWGFPTEEDR